MNITVTAAEPKDDKLEATLTVDAKDVSAAVKKAYREIANKYNFQGFRKGRTPRPVIDSLIGREAVMAQATNELLSQAEPLMLDELDVVPVGEVDYGTEPAIVEDGKEYSVTGTVTLRPSCELSSYDAVEIKMPPEEVTEAEIDEQIDTLQGYHATYEATEEGHEATEGDMLSLTVTDIENGENLAGDDRPYIVGSTAFPKEFDDAIRGMKAGDQKDIEFTVPGTTHEHEDGSEHKTEDKTVKLGVTVKEIKEHKTPVLDDEFAKKGYGFDTVAEFRDAVKEELVEDKKNQLPNLKETRAIEALTERLTLEEVPEAYAQQVFDEIAQNFMMQLQQQGITLDAWLQARRINAGDFINDLHEQAGERARQSLALDALAGKLGLDADAESVEKEFSDAGVQDIAATMKQFKAEGRMPAVRATVKRSKAVEWLVDNAKVTVVDEVAERRAKKAEEK